MLKNSTGQPRLDGQTMPKVALVMTGGGARGAYQAGVLKRIGELPAVQKYGNPFPIIGGASSGAVNGVGVAVGCDDFRMATRALAEVWSNISLSDVFRCDILSQAETSLAWILDLSLGGFIGGGNAQYLLDAKPFRAFLSQFVDGNRIQSNIKHGHLSAIAIWTTHYHSGKSYLFIQGKRGHPMWSRERVITLATRLTVDHICASAAIPLIFPPVPLKTPGGLEFFGDGCIRLHEPLSPAIRLGAEKVIAIGVRWDKPEHQKKARDEQGPSVAETVGVLINAIFLDHLVADMDHLQNINRLLFAKQKDRRGSCHGTEAVRPVSCLRIAPSVDLAEVATQHWNDMPGFIRYFVDSLGRNAATCADLMSYLLFTSKYTGDLVEIGYRDAGQRIDEIETRIYAA